VRIVSWNVNGLRACAKQGFMRWLDDCGADVVAVQEVRAQEADLPDEVCRPAGWHACFAAAERRGYSGVGVFSRRAPDAVEVGLGKPRFDSEGRVVIARFGRLVVASAYVPKGSGKERDNSRVPYKLAFSRALFARLQALRRRGYRVLCGGDFNTAHAEIDLARPADNRANSGFLPSERAEFGRWLEAGWVDTFRALHPDEAGHYTWWRQWGGARERNVGWRIDYVLASPNAAPFVKDAFIWPETRGSDHCPVGIDVDPAIANTPARAASRRRA
jgi:exodeoxyribonuclease III